MVHAVKIKPQYFKDLVTGKKTFEVRKNDHNYKVGDIIALNEFDDKSGYTDKSALFVITYVMTDKEYVKEGFAVLGVKRCYLDEKAFLKDN